MTLFRIAIFAWLALCSVALAQVGQIPSWPPNKPFGAAAPCTSTGVYDLSNTCNDIYFIGALK